MAYFYIGGKTRANEEIDTKPIYEGQCSIVIKNFYLAGPLARFSIYQDFIMLAYGQTKHLIQLSNISKIRLKGWIFKSITIEYADDGKQKKISFGPIKPRDAYSSLERAIRKET